jgi:hypothetical protein
MMYDSRAGLADYLDRLGTGGNVVPLRKAETGRPRCICNLNGSAIVLF